MAKRKDCLYSTVKNVSGGTLKFGFLPPHGKELEANEEYTFFGDVLSILDHGEYVTARRHRTAFETAVAGTTPKLDIVMTPAPIIYDRTNNYSKILVIAQGVLGYDDPCWDSEDPDD